MSRVRTGLERLLDDDVRLVRGRRIGVVAHPASVTASLRHAVDALRDAGADVAALFGPEHGLGGEAQDMEGVEGDPGGFGGPPEERPWRPAGEGAEAPRPGPRDAGATDGPPVYRAGRVPTYSLYGSTFESLSPKREWLDGLAAVVIDLQDVGSRYYTFVWTALLVARACREAGVEVLLCDRPNPLGGVVTEGAPQLERERSFVGLRSVPVRHALTAGELLRDAARDEGLGNVTVIPMEGWRRAMHWGDTGLPWVLPSPNMPTPDTATVYPGGCLLEGTNLSEGRGTTRPFELLGAPWADGRALAGAVAKHAGDGCAARVMTFRPTFQKHAGATCRGVQVHVTDRERFRSYRAYLAMIHAARRMDGFRWRTERYEFVDDRPAVDLLTGDAAVRHAIDAGADFEGVMGVGAERLEAWRATERERWLYEE